MKQPVTFGNYNWKPQGMERGVSRENGLNLWTQLVIVNTHVHPLLVFSTSLIDLITIQTPWWISRDHLIAILILEYTSKYIHVPPEGSFIGVVLTINVVCPEIYKYRTVFLGSSIKYICSEGGIWEFREIWLVCLYILSLEQFVPMEATSVMENALEGNLMTFPPLREKSSSYPYLLEIRVRLTISCLLSLPGWIWKIIFRKLCGHCKVESLTAFVSV
jgi:hypothetical protein